MKRFKIKMHLSIGFQGGHDAEETFVLNQYYQTTGKEAEKV